MNEPQDTVEIAKAPNSTMSKQGLSRSVPVTGTGKVQPRQAPMRPKPPVVNDEDDDESFLHRNMVALIAGAAVLIGAGWFVFGKPMEKGTPARKAPEPQMVKLLLPPPPPPPPKVQPTPPPREEKKIDQMPVDKPMDKPAEAKPVDKPPEGIKTTITGGPGTAGLLEGHGGGGTIGGGNGPGGGGNAARWYAGQVQSKIQAAVRNHPKMRNASIKALTFFVTVDDTGHITSTKLADSTGDPALDEVIKNEIMPTIQLEDRPPGGKPMTVKMRLTALRQN